MFKNFCIALAVVGVVFVGVRVPAVSALTTDEIQSQITALLAQIRELTNQLNALRQQPSTTTPSEGTDSSDMSRYRICRALYRNLGVGVSGDDVLGIQEYLREQGFYSGDMTGYFGPVTANAVAQWQTTQGLSSVGIVGPASRERILRWCRGGGWGNEKFRATPTQGSAPLTVYFKTNVQVPGPMIADAPGYKIIFGDGQEEQLVCDTTPFMGSGGTNGASMVYPSHCNPKQVSHTYATNGTYVATLVQYGGYCAGSCPVTTIGTVQISVGQTACTREYAPVCGAKPVVCITAPCNPVPTTYSNRCLMNADGASLLYSGACRTDYVNPADDPQCKAWFDGCNTCSRSTPGGMAMCTMMACVQGYPDGQSPPKPYCKSYFDGSGNKPPVISGISGPTTLAVSQMGTWSVNASDPENGTLSYDVTWGDEYVPYALMNSAAGSPSFIQSSTFTHTYSRAGTYTITVVVRDGEGQSAKTSTTVRVGESVGCTRSSPPVCGKPKICSGGFGAWPRECEYGKTYANRCEMEDEGGTFISEGMCRNDAASCRNYEKSSSTGTYIEKWYTEGQSTQCITQSPPQPNDLTVAKSCIADASYVCRSGQWKIEGGMPPACTMEYAPVCGQPKFSCPSGMYCAQMMPAPKTYGNKCQMNAEGATYLYSGACTTPSSGGLQVSSLGGDPRRVTITGPENLLAKIQSCVYTQGWYGPGGNGTTIDWGDGTISPSGSFSTNLLGISCADTMKNHTYTSIGSGTVTIKATIWHPGPTDAPITDWTGSTTYTIPSI